MEYLLSSKPPSLRLPLLPDPKGSSEEVAASPDPTNSGLSPRRTGSCGSRGLRGFSERSPSWRSSVDPDDNYYGAATAESRGVPCTSPPDTPAEVLSKWFPPGRDTVFGSLPDVTHPGLAASALPHQSTVAVGSEMIPVPGLIAVPGGFAVPGDTGIAVPGSTAQHGVQWMPKPARRETLLKNASLTSSVVAAGGSLPLKTNQLLNRTFRHMHYEVPFFISSRCWWAVCVLDVSNVPSFGTCACRCYHCGQPRTAFKFLASIEYLMSTILYRLLTWRSRRQTRCTRVEAIDRAATIIVDNCSES